MEWAMREILVVAYWFDPAPQSGDPEPYPVTVRFTGHRVGVKRRFQPGDRFTHDETIPVVVPGSGPIAVTARIDGITAGTWSVSAQVLEPARRVRGSGEQRNVTAAISPESPLVRLWRRWGWSVQAVEPATVNTVLYPFARVPGIIPGIWVALVTLGMIAALVTQSLVISHGHYRAGPAWAVFLIAIAVGIVGARVWYMVLHRSDQGHEHTWEAGWCIQGFLLGASGAAALAFVLLRVPAGIFLDAVAPGLMFGMAIGRVGCFFAGCCGGPPTASRWGIWSSDQHIGARRIPTQLMESALALGLGLVTLVAVLDRGPAGGAFFIAAVAAYTLVRQGILRLRAERRRTRLGGVATAAVAALSLVASVVVIVAGVAR
jgi:phosphatidylglycerol:prolipoprotein diacylglycerol transferase